MHIKNLYENITIKQSFVRISKSEGWHIKRDERNINLGAFKLIFARQKRSKGWLEEQ